MTIERTGADCWVNNPCHHTGLESFVCEVCGYPDPRKVVAALRAERDKLKAALEEIASWREGEVVTSLFDEPGSAETARQALRGEVTT